MPPGTAELFAIYGPAAGVIIVLGLIVKYLLDERKQTLEAHKVELTAERKRGDDLQIELLKEARGNADLAEQLKKALETLARGSA